jgi:hypothetical protein
MFYAKFPPRSYIINERKNNIGVKKMEKFNIHTRRHPLKPGMWWTSQNIEVTGREELNRIIRIFTADPEVKTLEVRIWNGKEEPEIITHFEERDIRTK